MRTRRLLTCLVCVALLGFAAPVLAASVLRDDLSSLVGRSERVVVGRVVDARAVMRGGKIITITRVEVGSMLKGEPAESLDVETLGGSLDGLGQTVAGEANLRSGEVVALFLERTASGALRPAGMAQGVVRVDVAPGGFVVRRDLEGLAFVDRAPDGRLVPSTTQLPAVQTLDAFVAEVARLVTAGAVR